MKAQIHKATTSKLVQIFIQDTSKTDGSGLTGLTFGSGSLSAYYYREGAATAVSISLQTMTAGTWVSGGFVVVDGTNLPGVYQLGLPDAALATGVNSVLVMLKGATNMAPVLLEIQLTDTDVNNATNFGLTDLDATISSRLATAAISLAAGAVTVGTNSDKSGYSLAANAVDASQFTQAAADKVWTSATRTLTAIGSSLLGGVWDSLRSDHPAAGTFGEGVTSVRGDVTGNVAGSVNSVVTAVDILQSAADKVWASVARTLTAFGFNVVVGANLDKTGYALSVAPPTAVQIDTQLSGTHGAGQWGATTGIGANAVTLTVVGTGAVPLMGISVTVKNQAQTAVVAVGLTDVNGQVVFNLDTATYGVLIISSPNYSNLPAQSLVVSGTTSATYTLTAFSPGVPGSASLCRVFGTLRKLDGTAAALSTVRFALKVTNAYQANDTVVVVQEIDAVTDTSGYFQADLTKSSQITAIGSTRQPVYLVTNSDSQLHHTFLVPDANSADLLSLVLSGT